MTLQEAAWEVSIAVGSIAIVTFIATKMISPLIKYVKAVNLRDEKIDSILAQFSANGGATIKDQLNRIELTTLTSNRAISAVASTLGLGMWKSDAKGNCIEVSDELCNILGRSESEVIGNNWAQWIHPDDKDRIWKAWSFCIANKTVFNERYRFIKDGVKDIEIHASAYHIMRSGESIGLIGLIKREYHVNVPTI